MRLLRLLTTAVASFLLVGVCSAQSIINLKGYVQVYDVESSLPLVKNKYTYENDTIKITYYFWGNKGIVQIGINNKLDKPIYIDWKKSFYKNTEHELTLAPEITATPETKRVYEMYAYEGRYLHSIDYEMNYHSATSDEFATKVEDVTEVKAYGYYMRLKYHLSPEEFLKFKETAKKLEEPSFTNEGEMETVYEADFTQETAPFSFKLGVVYAVDNDFKNAKTVSSDFHVSKAFEMKTKHFRGPKTGKDMEGRAIYKFPYRKSSRFYYEIDKKNALDTRIGD